MAASGVSKNLGTLGRPPGSGRRQKIMRSGYLDLPRRSRPTTLGRAVGRRMKRPIRIRVRPGQPAWRRFRLHKILPARPYDDPPQPMRVLEIDVIVTTIALWDATPPADLAYWTVIRLDDLGLVIAERDVG